MADSLLAALEELNEQELRASEYASDAVLVIDNDLRTIAVPRNFIFGVYNDKNVLSVNFEMPRTYDDVDLSDFTIQINYLAPNKVGNVYEVTDPVVGEDKITFEWLLDRGVFLSSGTVEFTVCLREIGQEGAIIREFNTTIAKGTVLAGLEIEDPEDPEAYSLIAHIKQMDERVASQAATVATDYAKVARMADEIEATAEELADDVAEVKEKYGTPLVAATAAGMTDQTKIYVYTGNETGYTFGNWYYWDGTAWMSGGVYNSAGINTDATLSVSGMPADAKKTGDEIAGLKEDLEQIVPGLSDEAKEALLACFAHVAWIDEDGQDYYDALEDALNGEDPPTPTVIHGWLYRFNDSLLSSGDKDFNFIGVGNYIEGVNGKAYRHLVSTEGDSSTDVGAIYKTGVADADFPFTEDFTLSTWHKSYTDLRGRIFGLYKYISSESIDGINHFFSNVNAQSGTGWTFASGYATATAPKSYSGVRLQWTNAGKLLFSVHNNTITKSAYILMTPPSGFSSLEWHHYAFTREDNDFYFFIDGVLIWSATSSESVYKASQITLGAAFGNDSASASTILSSALGNAFDDYYIADYCKWKTAFDPSAIEY